MQFGFTQYQFDNNAGTIVTGATTVDMVNSTATMDYTHYQPSTGQTIRETINYTLTEE